MIRFTMFTACAMAVFQLAGSACQAQAPFGVANQQASVPRVHAQPATYQGHQAARPVQPVGHQHHQVATMAPSPSYGSYGHNESGMYPQLNAPLYPSPQPNTPTYVGGTYITNQAFSPHEMLYPHDYHSMYGPYYWRVKGHWVLTPFGVRSHEKWQLQGTEVKVKYRSQIPLFAGFCPPGLGKH